MQRFNDVSEMPRPRTRTIKDSTVTQLFIVPGGRYLVTSDGGFSLSVWDLGYVSTVECKLVSSVDLENDGHMKVQATPDGKGLVILWIYR